MPLDTDPYDALLLVSFGGPEKPEDVLPFLENVTRGRGIPRERLVEVGEHYYGFGGRSPINDQNRAFISAVEEDFRSTGIDLPVYWGNRNWDPYLADTLQRMKDDGIRRAACLVTSAYSSYSGCRQYRENLAEAVATVGEGAPQLDRLRHYFNHPGFVEPMVDATLSALAGARRLRPPRRARPVRHALHPRVDERHRRARGRRVRRPAPRRRRRGRGAGPPGDRAPLRHRAGVLLALRAAARPVARARRQRPDRGARAARASAASWSSRSGSSRTTWRSSTTSTPRRRRPPRRPASSSPGPPRRRRPALRGDGPGPAARARGRRARRGGPPRAASGGSPRRGTAAPWAAAPTRAATSRRCAGRPDVPGTHVRRPARARGRGRRRDRRDGPGAARARASRSRPPSPARSTSSPRSTGRPRS